MAPAKTPGPPVLSEVWRLVAEADAAWPQVAASDTIPPHLVKRTAELGLLRLTVPAEYGGCGLATTDYQPYLEAAAHGPGWLRMLVHVGNGFWRPLAAYGSPGQRALITGMATGDVSLAFALTEQAGGTGRDLHSRAARSGGDWLVSGEKHLITFADRADYFLLTVATDDRGAADSLTTFCVPRDNPGLRIDTSQRTMGLAGTGHGILSYDAMPVDDAHRLGEVGQGLAVATSFLDYSRVSLATAMVGLAQRALDESVRYARTRRTFGKPIGDRQAVQVRLAQMAADVAAARALVYEAGRRHAAGGELTSVAATAKLFCQQMVGRVTDAALQVHGGLGYTTGSTVERIYRDARGFWFEEGTAEIQQLVIARGLLAQGGDR
ncbi:MAG TPA: acyl-CoA dehydrogenase family protein [Nocardioidaceae bacterium]|nr:acyl-CoA dehydrogenase family protein [Nocardioidaceae bacterium]